jgi:hypothetical protein
MRKTILTGVLAAIVLSSSALAGDMTGYYGNTVACKYANGEVTKVMVDANGTFMVMPTGRPSSTGNWVDDGKTVCYTQTSPAPGPNQKPVCNSSELRKVGDTWAVTDPFGGQCTATLTGGRS